MSARESGADRPFAGFVAGGAATTLPAQLFVELLPQIDDEAELRVTLYALYAIQRRRGPLRAVRGSELAAESPLARALASRGGAEAVPAALDRAVARGTLLACALADGDALYFVNSEGGRRALLRVQSGALDAPGARVRERPPPALPPDRPAAVYEQEIGTLTPAVAEGLARAAERYPEQWTVDALRLAATSNRRSWRYVDGILRRWEVEGRDDETSEGAAPGADAGDDPFARVVRRSWP